MAVDGTWQISYSTMGGGQQAKVELVTKGGALTGRWGGTEIADAAVDGNSVSWSVMIATPHGEAMLGFEGEVDGDQMTGTLLTAGGDSKFTGTRV